VLTSNSITWLQCAKSFTAMLIRTRPWLDVVNIGLNPSFLWTQPLMPSWSLTRWSQALRPEVRAHWANYPNQWQGLCINKKSLASLPSEEILTTLGGLCPQGSCLLSWIAQESSNRVGKVLQKASTFEIQFRLSESGRTNPVSVPLTFSFSSFPTLSPYISGIFQTLSSYSFLCCFSSLLHFPVSPLLQNCVPFSHSRCELNFLVLNAEQSSIHRYS